MTLTFKPIALTHRDPNEPSHTPCNVTNVIMLRITEDGVNDKIGNKIAGKVPETLAPTIVVPPSVVAAAIVVIAPCTAEGLTNPGIVNVIAVPPVNMPALNVTIKILFVPVPSVSTAAPAGLPLDGAVNATLTEPARAMPAPLSVMMILLMLATHVTGVSVTLMVTAVAPFATLLRVMAGCKIPREVPARMAG